MVTQKIFRNCNWFSNRYRHDCWQLYRCLFDTPHHHCAISPVLLFTAYIGVFLFICIFLFVKDKQPSTDDAEVATTRSYGELCHQLWLIIKKPQMWLIGIVGTLLD